MPRPRYFERERLRFECSGCGHCCIDGAGGFVRVGDDEAHAICEALNLTWPWFRLRYLKKLATGGRGIRLSREGRCPFLDDVSGCRVYTARPLQCRAYPFWPELVSSRQAWQAEARRCQGIGHGRAVARARIQRWLDLDGA